MVAFSDMNETRAKEAAEQYGTPDAQVYTDYRKLLERPDIDVVHITYPNYLHAQIAVDAMEAGKHVMCEKPMAINALEAASMAKTAKRTGRKLTVAYQNRYRPEITYLKKICSGGLLGEIYYAKALAVRRRAVPTWGHFLNRGVQGGGALIDIGSHALDLTLWLMDNYQWESVTGSVYNMLSQRKNAVNAWDSWEPERFTVEEMAYGLIKMSGGATVTVEASWALNTLHTGEAMFELCGTEGGADLRDGLRINGEANGTLYVTKPELKVKGVDYYASVDVDPGFLEMKQWVDCLRNNTDPVVLPDQALVVTQIIDAIYQSAQTGKTICNPAVKESRTNAGVRHEP
jgi:predicted dehydrogenase